ncbi:MAG: glutamate--tRNA ligase [Eubacteriales bacterium]
MNTQALADLLFTEPLKTPEEYEEMYPERELPEGAKVTRMAPSPTGFMHLGNLFGAITDERLAHQSGGIFYLRIEDTDKKREVEGGVETILKVFRQFGLHFDEGATLEGDNGVYGPYRQRQREMIYKSFAKSLVLRGLAYPCFCTEEELADMRARQEANKENFGYYGKYAKYRDCPLEEVERRIKAGEPWVLRFRSMGDPAKKVYHTDLIKGKMEFPENDQDVVLLKSDGIPTYHFAHVIDDHLMRTNVVVRGEEWLATLPIHLQLFDTLGFKRPKYAHTAQLMKMDEGSKRKLSKRKDPELALDFYHAEGYPVPSVIEYLLTLLNSNFEEWRLRNPQEPVDKFPFSTKKMSVSGSLFDVDKLKDVSKNVIAQMDAKTVYDYVTQWAQQYDAEFAALLTRDPAYTQSILAIGRGGKKPRKDIAIWSEVKAYMGFFFDELFHPEYEFPSNVSKEDTLRILEEYHASYQPETDMNVWFEKVCSLSEAIGFAPSTKEYRANPEAYRGHPGDTSMVLRVAVTGRQNAPDLFTVMNILGPERVKQRLNRAYEFVLGE